MNVVVLGMHRSGTSAVAAALQRAGLYGWDEDEAMPASAENPAGFGERNDIMQLNERLLGALGWTWDAPDARPPSPVPALAELVEEGRQLVAGELAAHNPWFVKDPRLSLLLPWWRRILLDRFIAVVAVRPAEEVAWSLAVRNGFPLHLGFALCHAYRRHMVSGLQGLPVVVVDYPALTERPAEVVVQLLSELTRLGLSGDLNASGAVRAIHPQLRRPTQPKTVVDAYPGREAVLRSWSSWSGGHVTAYDRFALEVDEPAAWEASALELQRKLRGAEVRASLAAGEHATALADSQASAIVASRARAEADAARDEATLARAAEETARAELAVVRSETQAVIEAKRREVERARETMHSAQRSAHEANLRVRGLHDTLEAASKEAQRASAELQAVRGVVDERDRQLAEARTEASTVQSEAASARAELEAIRADLGQRAASWRSDVERLTACVARLEGELAVSRASAMKQRWPARARRLASAVGLRGYVRANPLFDRDWYRAAYLDVALVGVDPYWHYRSHGFREGRNPNALFDTDWYIARCDELRQGSDPLDHYLRRGWREGLDPSPRFHTSWYLAQNPDVAAAGLNPLLHYLRYGAREGRQPRPPEKVMTGSPSIFLQPGSSPSPSVEAGDGGATLLAGLSDLAGTLPDEACVAVLGASEGDLPAVLQRRTTAFPRQPEDPQRAHSFDNSTSAIANLEAVRADGASHLLITAGAGRWLVDRPTFAAHLARYPVIVDDPRFVLYCLDRPYAPEQRAIARVLPDFREEFGLRHGRQPAVLDLDTAVSLERYLRGAEVISPERRHNGSLPYADASIDVVAVPRGSEAASEAQRVARSAVLTLAGPSPDSEAEVHWQGADLQSPLPSASILIPTYNGSHFVQACLRTLRETVPPHIEADIVIVDDASTDGSIDVLQALAAQDPRITLVANPANLGFVGSINRGADFARGQILVLLNNDTLLLPGWLTALLRTFRDKPDAGAVGGKLVYPDGRLQEAGGIIFADGSAANFGYGDADPEQPQYSYLREVDYVSGALLATPRDLFEELGRLDPVYGFGYYDDGDYCFKLRERGLRAYFNPESVIVHLEGGTAGTDLAQGTKRQQVVNREIFVGRWQRELADQPAPPERWLAEPRLVAPHRSPGAT